MNQAKETEGNQYNKWTNWWEWIVLKEHEKAIWFWKMNKYNDTAKKHLLWVMLVEEKENN